MSIQKNRRQVYGFMSFVGVESTCSTSALASKNSDKISAVSAAHGLSVRFLISMNDCFDQGDWGRLISSLRILDIVKPTLGWILLPAKVTHDVVGWFANAVFKYQTK
jgi:hypothetical protein